MCGKDSKNSRSWEQKNSVRTKGIANGFTEHIRGEQTKGYEDGVGIEQDIEERV